MGRGRASFTVVLVASLLLGGPAIRAFADVTNSTGTNIQDGNNSASGRQGGKSASGDAVGGQVTGVVASGRTSVDARNVSKDSSVESGDARASNSSSSFVGLAHSDEGDLLIGSEDVSFISLDDHGNLQDGNNRQTITQTANATTGDGVAGEVIGVVTAAGGSASVVASNTSNNSDVTTGDARADNASFAFVGLADLASEGSGEFVIGTSDVDNVVAGNDTNIQDGNNRQTLSQSASSATGDGVAGQVIGVVAAGATSVDANNTSDGVSVDTGDAHSTNNAGAAVGLVFTENEDSGEVEVNPADVSNIDALDHVNLQDGNNAQTARQTASSTTGDGVAGQVIGAVTSAGGSASIVAANTSRDSDVTTGNADSTNEFAAFVGNATNNDEIEIGTGDVTNVSTTSTSNIQDGNNRQSLTQSSAASTGDGVAGQVVGAVSAGRTSIDARNSTDGVSVETGNADSSNQSNTYVGLASSRDEEVEVVIPADITNVAIGDGNVQDGNNRQTLSQSSTASTGDGVAGEVIGAVTSAGGSASVVAANTSSSSDVTTGDATSDNDSGAFVGQANSPDQVEVENADIDGVAAGNANVQDGNNSQTLSQSSTSSTGDGVAGQVIGAVSAGATSIDARNTTDNVDITTGDANASNDSGSFVGLALSGATTSVGTTDISNVSGDLLNVQDGTNRQAASQSASASSGDGVGGQVIGSVTSAGGSASIVAANKSTDVSVETGDADASNSALSFVGLANDSITAVGAADISFVTPTAQANVQDGNNRQTLAQTANASTGDGVGGQVIGVVSAGRTSVDANNVSDNSDVTSGDANASNSSTSFVGLAAAVATVSVAPADVTGVSATNSQDGNNRKTVTQSAEASSGDAVAGQVAAGVTAGIITGAGGDVSVVVANTSSGIDATSGDGNFSNDDFSFVGLAAAGGPVVIGAPLT